MNHTKQKEELIEKILEWAIKNVSETQFEEPAFALCIAYDPAAEFFFGAGIGIGLESERLKMTSNPKMKERVKQYGVNYLYGSLYNPAHFKNFGTSPLYKDNDEVYSLGQSLAIKLSENLAINEGKFWDDFYHELGLKLAQVEWSKYLKITSDFVVYTTDLELSILDQNFKASVPKNIRQKLFENGWLPKDMI